MPGIANPQHLNRYSYVSNNPLRYIDPTGHSPLENEYGGGCSTSGYCPGSSNNNNDTNHTNNPSNDDDGDVWTPNLTVPELGAEDSALVNSSAYTIPTDLFELITSQVQPGTSLAWALGCAKGAASGAIPSSCIWHGPMLGYDISRVNGTNLVVDTASFIASFFAMNTATQVAKRAMVTTGGLSGLNSASQNDATGVGLSIAGFFPVIGIYASGASVVRDLSAGVYEVQPLGPPAPLRSEPNPHTH